MSFPRSIVRFLKASNINFELAYWFISEGKKATNPIVRSKLKIPKEQETPLMPQLLGNKCRNPVYPMDAITRISEAEANLPFPTMMASPIEFMPLIP